MAEKCLIGIDNGGSQIKCAVFSLEGRELAVASRSLPMDIPAPGFTERDANLVWEANADAIAEALEKAGIAGEDVLGVGLTGYGNGILLFDEQGEPVSPAIVSTDERANDLCDELAEAGVEREVYQYTYQGIWAAQPAAMLPWFKRNDPATLESARWCLGIKDWVRLKLTGEFATEMTEASSGCLLNLDTRDWDSAIFEALGIPELARIMPPVFESAEVTGTVTAEAAERTGLVAGTPVAAGYFDIDAAAFASGVADEGTLCLIAGTWSINEYLAKSVEKDYDTRKNTVTLGYRPGFFNVEESWATSASNFDWYVKNFVAPAMPGIALGDVYAEADKVIDRIDPRDSDVVFVPFLFSSSAASGAKATFLNLTSYNTADHVLLSVFEGICLNTRDLVARLDAPAGGWRSARLSGGVAKSPEWAQMMADVLGMQVVTLANSELTAQGAAMGAGVAAGVFDGFDDAIGKMVRVGQVFDPRPEYVAVYEEKFKTFKRALDALAVFHA